MCSNRPLVYSAAALDWEPRPPRLPLRLRIAGWFLSRAEFVHRELKALYRTWYGFLLVWLNIELWAMVAVTRILGL